MVRSIHVAPVLLAALAAASLGACNAPSTEKVQTAAKPPQAISGGSMALTVDGRTAIVADTERDRVLFVDVASMALKTTVQLNEGDEPGRIAEDAAGRLHVVLRGAGAVATIDASGKVTDRSQVCAAPRGVTFDGDTNKIMVACSGGELVTLPAEGGASTKVMLDRDLRDVVKQDGRLYVSHFRSTELSAIDEQGQEIDRVRPVGFQGPSKSFTPSVAWRTRVIKSGKIVIGHQHSADSAVATVQPSGYDGSPAPNQPASCDGPIVHGAVSIFDPASGTMSTLLPLDHAAVPVDLDALDVNGDVMVAVAAAGSERVIVTSKNAGVVSTNAPSGCGGGQSTIFVPDQPIAVQFVDQATILVQTRNAPKLLRYELTPDGWTLVSHVDLADATAELTTVDTGHDLFHKASSPSGGIACASCHPEGGDDGRTWSFDNGPRRTQNLRGGVSSTAPFHWDGDMHDFGMIMSEVFVHRMGGKTQDPAHVAAVAAWVDTIPLLPITSLASSDAVARGQALFESAATGCATCHNGPKLTNNQSADVGTDPSGRQFQVPSLVGLAHRAPYFHDGSITSIKDRFVNPAAGGEAHGHTAQLSEQDVDDMVAYLETL